MAWLAVLLAAFGAPGEIVPQKQRKEAKRKGEERRFRLRPFYWILGVVAAIGVVAVVFQCQGRDSPAPRSVQVTLSPGELAEVRGVSVGPPRAPVTILELADSACPACDDSAALFNPVGQERWVEPGEAPFIHHGLPLVQSPLSDILFGRHVGRQGIHSFFSPVAGAGAHLTTRGDVPTPPSVMAGGVDAEPDFELAPLDLRYRGVIQTTVLAAYREGEFYLPVAELFRLALIDHTINVATGKVTGFFIDPEVLYELDATTGSARFDGRSISLNPDDFIVGEVEVYARPEVFAEVFGMHFRVRMETLSLFLDFEGVLPVVARADRRARADRIGDDPFYRPEAELRFDRDRRFFAGGALDYSLRTAVGPAGTQVGGTGRVGMEALGGELSATVSGMTSTAGSSLSVHRPQLAWRFRENRWLSEIRLGGLGSQLVTRRPYRGIRVTNRPIDPRRHMGTFRFREQVPPGWEVEIYRGERMIRSFVVGEDGEIDLRLPIAFGTTDYNVRVFGPEGQVREIGYRIPAPTAFLPRGEFEYHAEAGALDAQGSLVTVNDPDPFGSLSTYVGLSDWATGGVAVASAQTDSGWVSMASATGAVRFFASHVGQGEVRTDGGHRFGIQSFLPSQASWNLEYAATPLDTPFGEGSAGSKRLSGHAYLPFTLGDRTFVFRPRADRRWRHARTATGTVRLELDARWGGTVTTLGYHSESVPWLGGEPGWAAPADQVRLAIRGGLRPARPVVGEWLSRVHLRSVIGISSADGSLRDWESALSRRIGRAGQLSIGLGQRSATSGVGFDVRYSHTLPQAYSTTEIRGRSVEQPTLSQTVRGSIAYHGELGRPVLDRGTVVGHGGVIFRPFVDHKGTGRLDPEDHIITADVIRFRQPVVRAHDRDRGLLRVSGLRADGRYTVEILQERVPNPLWMPAIEEFSFVVDPNRFKVIDLPFYVAGVVEGRVTVQDGDRSRAIPGIRVRIEGVEADFVREVSTFSDGSYYLMGIPPGSYTATVDPDQQAMLGVAGEPVAFEVRVTEHGDFVGNVNLTLAPASP